MSASVSNIPKGPLLVLPHRGSSPMSEQPTTPSDTVSFSGGSAKANDFTTLTLRVKVKNSLLEPDANGKSRLDDLEPDFVPKGKTSENAPTFLSALEDPVTIPQGYVPVSTVALVPEAQAQDLEQLNRDYFAAFVPLKGYVLSQQEVDDYAQEQQQIGFQNGVSQGLEQGASSAVPAGHQVKLMDSPAGLKIEARRDQISTLVGLIGGNSSALGIAKNIGLPVAYAAPLAVAVAPLQILGTTGTLSTTARLEHQRAALLESVRAENPGQDPMQVVLDMNPHTQMPITTQEAIRNIDLLKTGQTMKTVGSALLLGAGVAALGGWGAVASGLAVGSLASPLGDALPGFDQLAQVTRRSRDLRATLESRTRAAEQSGVSPAQAKILAGQTLVEVQVPLLNQEGRPVGFEPGQIPLGQALAHVSSQQRLLAVGAVGAVAQVGSVVAMGLGCPIMLAVGASAALPLLTRGAMFPRESWQGLSALPAKIWNDIKVVAQALGRKLGVVKGGDAEEMTAAQKRLFEALAQIADRDPLLGKVLQATLETLHKLPQSEQEERLTIAAAQQHQEALSQLRAKHPQLSAQFESSLQALVQENSPQAAPDAPKKWSF